VSFRLKVILSIAVIEMIVLGVLTLSSISYLRHTNEQELLRRAQVTAQLMATMTSDAIVAFDLASLDSLVDQAMKNDTLIYARVRLQDGRILSQAGPQAILERPFQADEHAELVQDGILDISAPIIVGGNIFGFIEIGLSNDLIHNTVREGLERMALMVVINIALVALLGAAFGTVLTRQLKALQEGAGRVAKGDFGYQMSVKGKDELAETARSFNSMSYSLAKFAKEAESARQKAEQGREKAETLLRSAMNTMPYGIVILDKNFKIVFFNKATGTMYPQLNESLAIGSDFINFLHKKYKLVQLEENTTFEQSMTKRLAMLKDDSEDFQWQSLLKDGRHILHLQRYMPNGHIVIVDTDVTELYAALEKNRQLEMELMQTHKMESLGTLAAGIAHEINTPVQFIGDNLHFFRDSFTDIEHLVQKLTELNQEAIEDLLEESDWDFIRDELPTALKDAEGGVQAIRNIVQSVKAFSHPDTQDKEPTDPVTLIENAITVSRGQWKHSANVSTDFHHSPEAFILCHPGDISQVLINLIVNAAQAIEEMGRDEPGEIKITTQETDGMLTIQVQDNGPGIPEKNLPKVFDMFFTTKDPGKGTGQGLAICQQLIESKNNGKLTVHSQAGQGATFMITLPLDQSFDDRTKQANQAEDDDALLEALSL
jgi:signal transduction histidine kinase/HAMP domain-containing protein